MAVKILSDLGCPEDTELSVSIVGDQAIRRINREYLAKDRPTNVISFSLQEGDATGIHVYALGDVVISADTAQNEAEAGGQALSRVFNIVDEDMRQPIENPVSKVLEEGNVVGLANHTLLISKNGIKIPIEPTGLTPRSLYSSISIADSFCLLPLV